MKNKLKQDHYKVTSSDHPEPVQYKEGRGAQINTPNKFLKSTLTKENTEGIDEWIEPDIATQYIESQAKGIVNKKYNPFDPIGLDEGEFVKEWTLRMNISREDILEICNKVY